MNDQETYDFMEFWYPRMQDSPYYYITFMPQEEFELLAPLTVEPRPDSIIRVFMDYKPLDAPIRRNTARNYHSRKKRFHRRRMGWSTPQLANYFYIIMTFPPKFSSLIFFLFLSITLSACNVTIRDSREQNSTSKSDSEGRTYTCFVLPRP